MISTERRIIWRWSSICEIGICTTQCAMNSQPASRAACGTAGQVSQTPAFKESVGVIPSFAKASRSRQNPTRIPYSCHVQLGKSGICATPMGGPEAWRAMARVISHSSTLTTGQTTSVAPSGSASGGRSAMAEYAMRSRGCFMAGPSRFV